ncbi:hypothetical protein HYFRA_00009756 [Hymenoscyphus fraxineus]|uniref:RING-type domain-containing protein n=1 Tax=Hymenoscyphus fraxineus TaxID=746836 RepID=A0A9N9KU05_9HELO|nr:hypothetical protein HYFRA_00009756 [Hymenoscyphus fraxineus]
MCRQYKVNWACGCQPAESSVIFFCPASHWIGQSWADPIATLIWDTTAEHEVTESDLPGIACFGETYNSPIGLDFNRSCKKCPLPSSTNDEVEIFTSDLEKADKFSSFILDEEYLTLFAQHNNFFYPDPELRRHPSYQDLRKWADLSPEDLECVVSRTNKLETLLRKVEVCVKVSAAREKEMLRAERIHRNAHFRAISTNIQRWLEWLKWIELSAMILTKDGELFPREPTQKPNQKLLTEVSLEELDKEDLECAVCSVTFGQEGENHIVETCVETPCHHKFGSSCAHRWFVLDEHPTCPFCRESLPSELFEYPDHQQRQDNPHLIRWVHHLQAPFANPVEGSEDELNIILAEQRTLSSEYQHILREYTDIIRQHPGDQRGIDDLGDDSVPDEGHSDDNWSDDGYDEYYTDESQ